MDKIYLYNEGTGTLHIKGCCQYVNENSGCKSFASENEAIAYAGRAVKPCKVCMRKREKLLEEAAK